MSKADRAKKRAKSKAQVAKVAPIGLPPIPQIPKREGNGRTSRAAVPRDPHVEMLKARCRRWGIPSSRKDEMRDPWWGCEAGGAMAKATTRLDERKALWDAICWMRRTVIAFDRAIGAPNRHAQCLRLMLPNEAMEATGDDPAPDDRTDEEKEDDAVRGYQWLGELSARAGQAAQSEAYRVVLDDQRARDVAALLSVLRQISLGIDPRALT